MFTIIFICFVLLFILLLINTIDSITNGCFDSSKFPNPTKKSLENITEDEKNKLNKILKKYNFDINLN